MNKTVILPIFLFLTNNICISQQIDTFPNVIQRFLLNGLKDTSDMAAFFEDTTSFEISEPKGGGDGKYCNNHHYEKASEDIHMANFEDPYIKIFEDDFDVFDRSMWMNTNIGSHVVRDYFVSYDQYNPNRIVTYDEKSNVQTLYLSRNVHVSNGSLQILTKREDLEVPWDTGGYWPWGPTRYGKPVNKHVFKYTSGWAIGAWALDGAAAIQNGSLKEKETGIVVVARIKRPRDSGLWPAYWYMGYEIPGYSEFDVFEFMHNKHDVLVTSLHNDSLNTSFTRCSEDTRVDDYNNNDYLYYMLIWNTHFIAAYISDHENFSSSMTKCLYMRHQIARDNRIGQFPVLLKKDERYRRRKMFITEPMRINFNTAVYLPIKNELEVSETINNSMLIDYIKVYKQLECPYTGTTILDERSDLKIRDGVFNVQLARDVLIDFSAKPSEGIYDNEFLKLICVDDAIIQQMSISPTARFVIEHKDDYALCLNAQPDTIGVSANAGLISDDTTHYSDNAYRADGQNNLPVRWELRDILGRIIMNTHNHSNIYNYIKSEKLLGQCWIIVKFDKNDIYLGSDRMMILE